MQNINKYGEKSNLYGNQQKEESSDKMTVQPGYTKYVIDEQKADYDYIKGKFTDDEIKEVFKILDINKSNHITADNLSYFLEYLGEKATDEEIEEMIKMCDLDGNGEVSYDEFYKLATGQSLAPIGQAYTPTPEMQVKREKLEQLMNDETDSYFNGQIQNRQKKLRQQMKEYQTNQFDQNQYQNPQQNNFMQSNNQLQQQQLYQTQTASQIYNKEQQLTQNKINEYQGSIKQILNQRQKLFKKLVKEQKITGSKIKAKVDEYIKQQQQNPEVMVQELNNYEEFAQFLNVPIESNTLQDLYNNLIDMALLDDVNQMNQQQTIDVHDLLLMLLGTSQEIKINEKYDAAFYLLGLEKIDKEHLFQIVLLMTFKAELDQDKLEQKIKVKYNSGSYKKYLKPREIDKKLYDDLINSFPTYFY